MSKTVVAAELAGAAALSGALAAGARPAFATAIALAAAVVLFIPLPVRALHGRSIAATAHARARHALLRAGLGAPARQGPIRRAGDLAAAVTADAPAQSLTGGPAPAVPPGTGLRFDGPELVCAVQVRPRHPGMTTLRPGRPARTVPPARTRDRPSAAGPPPGSAGPQAPEALAPARLAPLLDQYDVHLSGIDIVTRAARTAGPAAARTVVSRLIGPLHALARRDTVLVIRLDPARCPEAVARRGGGTRGAAAAATVAAARIIRALESRGLSCTAFSADDLAAAGGVLAGGGAPAAAEPRWNHVRTRGAGAAVPASGGDGGGEAVAPAAAYGSHASPAPEAPGPRGGAPGPAYENAVHTSYRVPLDVLRSGPWDEVFAPRCDSAVLAVRLRPSTRAGNVQVSGLVRYVSTGPDPVPAPPGLGLIELPGAQADALWATSMHPAARADPLGTGTDAFADSSPEALAPVALGGQGQLLGGDRAGNAVMATLVGPRVRSVDVSGDAYTARQVVVRALATGARILVLTDRPGEWRHLEAELADRTVLRVEPAAPEASDPARPGSFGSFGVIVLDLVDAPGVHGAAPLPDVPADATVMTVLPRPAPDAAAADRAGDASAALTGTPPEAGADAVVRQDPQDPSLLHVDVRGRRATVTMVSLPDEARLIGRPSVDGRALV